MASARILVPSALSLAGVGSGFVCLISLVEGRYLAGMAWMFVAIVLDGLDGKIAAMLDCKTDFGATLDSLCDAVSFAVLPGLAAFLFFRRAPEPGPLLEIVAWSSGITYTCAGVFREVRFMAFQAERTRDEGFVGLPIAPPAGLNVALLCLAQLAPRALHTPLRQTVVFLVVMLNAYLMTGSRIRYLRWGGRAIAAQTLLAGAAAAAAYLRIGGFGTALAVFFVAFCAIYILFHPIRALARALM